jgi:hypothetical protein
MDLIYRKRLKHEGEKTKGADQQNFTISEERLQNRTLILSHHVEISWCGLTRDSVRGSPTYVYIGRKESSLHYR